MKAYDIIINNSGTMKFPAGWHLIHGKKNEPLEFFDPSAGRKIQSMFIEKKYNRMIISVNNDKEGTMNLIYVDPYTKTVTREPGERF